MYRKKFKIWGNIVVLMLSASILTGFSKADSSETQKNTAVTSNSEAIPGNGRHFVQYDGHVYFRIPTDDTMKLSAIWGSYDDIEENTTGKIVAMDCDTLETEELFEDNSKGPIVISGDRLILSTNSTIGQQNVRSVSLDGSDSKDLPGTNIYGTQPSGKYFVTGGFNSDDHKLHLYICDEEGNYKEPASSNRLYDYAAIGETQLLCITSKGKEPSSLSGFDLNSGKETVYGKLPKIPEADKTSCVTRKIAEEDGYVYLRFSFYNNSSNNFKGSKYAKIKVGKAYSLEEITPEETSSNSENERYAPSVMLKDGKLIYVEGKPNSASLDAEGDIGFYDDNGKFTKVVPGYETVFIDDNKTRMAAEAIEAVDGYIYVIQNKECRVPKDDEGLRYAYKRLETSFIRIDEKTGESVTISHCVNPDVNKSDSDKESEVAKTKDPLTGLVRSDILKKFRASNPYREGNDLSEEARRLGCWVKDSIKTQMPESLKEHGNAIGAKYEFYFGTDIGNNLDNNFPYIYKAYFTLKSYYYNGQNVEFYNSLIEDNSYLGDGNPETIDQMFKDLQLFVTECNNFIRKK